MAGSDSAMLGQAQALNGNMGLLIATLKSLFPLSAFAGTFTMAAAATKVVTDTHVKATSTIVLVPTNAAAATLQGAATQLYTSVKVAGTSFTVATASGGSAAGTEQFAYLIVG